MPGLFVSFINGNCAIYVWNARVTSIARMIWCVWSTLKNIWVAIFMKYDLYALGERRRVWVCGPFIISIWRWWVNQRSLLPLNSTWDRPRARWYCDQGAVRAHRNNLESPQWMVVYDSILCKASDKLSDELKKTQFHGITFYGESSNR